MTPALRHLTSINDLTIREMEQIFEVANQYLNDLHDTNVPYRIGNSVEKLSGKILAALFYEPSTRTRLSFESAMLRLGGKAISSADPLTSSAAKGESLADTVRVASNYADLLVIRHPRDGAAQLAAQYSSVPVVNGGDGSHEHPTQTLSDLFTLLRENKTLKNLNVAICGDLKGSRTVHSFVYALARFGALITPIPAPGMELPEHVLWRLRNEFHCFPVSAAKDTAVDAIYVTANEPHQLSLLNEPDIVIDADLGRRIEEARKRIDAVYVTRYQKERRTEHGSEYPRVDEKFLRDNKYRNSSVLHPLPRVGELDAGLDSDPRAAYFRQAAYGVPIRMALISLLLERAPNDSFETFESGFRDISYPLYCHADGDLCPNANCVTHDPLERQYTENRYYVVKTKPGRLRCFYCESDIGTFLFAERDSGLYFSSDEAELPAVSSLIVFRTAREAETAGFREPMENRRKKLASVDNRTSQTR